MATRFQDGKSSGGSGKKPDKGAPKPNPAAVVAEGLGIEVGTFTPPGGAPIKIYADSHQGKHLGKGDGWFASPKQGSPNFKAGLVSMSNLALLKLVVLASDKWAEALGPDKYVDILISCDREVGVEKNSDWIFVQASKAGAAAVSFHCYPFGADQSDYKFIKKMKAGAGNLKVPVTK